MRARVHLVVKLLLLAVSVWLLGYACFESEDLLEVVVCGGVGVFGLYEACLG